MAPISLNPPGPFRQGQNQLFTSPNIHDSTSLSSCRIFFNTLDQRGIGELRNHINDQEVDKIALDDDGSASNDQIYNPSFVSPKPVMGDTSSGSEHNLSFNKMDTVEEESKSSHGSPKWMSSKMRLMKKMMRPSSSTTSLTDKAINTTATSRFQNQGQENSRHSQRSPSSNSNNINSTNRVCADCNTSTTPLWRSGPMGPKSLCNACGIRQRKARRAMAEAANGGLATPMDASSSTKIRVHSKEKKSRINHFTPFKNKCKPTTTTTTTTTTAAGTSDQGEQKKLEIIDFETTREESGKAAFQQVFPHDEVAEAALLLMDLSCGFKFNFN